MAHTPHTLSRPMTWIRANIAWRLARRPPWPPAEQRVALLAGRLAAVFTEARSG